ncbi:MAG TPA: hypothetical protein VFQ72_01865 [Candidatus Paceibacterota bacterium]|nr:hypothetical protein [Candidatus Paceibacterota bacterium]
MKLKIVRFFAWALALIAFVSPLTASAKCNIAVSVAPESPRRTAFRQGDGYRVLSVFRIANTGDTTGRVDSLWVIKRGLAAVVAETSESSSASEYNYQSPDAPVSVYVGLTLKPGQSANVALRGIFVYGSPEVYAAVDGFGGNFDSGQIEQVRPAAHAVVDEIETEGIGNTSMLVGIAPSSPATLGFVVKGDSGRSYPVLIRAVGPGLKKFGISDALADPSLKVRDQAGNSWGENDDWDSGYAETFAGVGAFPLDKGSLDSAFVAWLAPGSYTAQVKGFGTGAGRVLIEMYQLPVVYGKG